MTTQTNNNAGKSGAEAGAVEFVEKLRTALKRDGDFPANAKLVGELRMLVSDPKTTANQVTELILKEPSLGTRVLHMVNSSFYRRAKPIMTVSQAVIQIGMRPLAELCAGLVLLQKFVPAARRGGPFAACLQRTIITSLLTSTLSSNLNTPGSSKADETGYLAGSFSELGVLLLAYYFPQIYDNALRRAETKKHDIRQSIHEITGLSPIQLSIEVINALNLPEFYKHALLAVQDVIDKKNPDEGPPERQNSARLAKALFASQKISTAVVHSKSKQELDSTIQGLKQDLNLDAKVLNNIVGELPQIFKNHCNSIDLVCPPLPEYVAAYGSTALTTSGTEDEQPVSDEVSQFSSFVEEIREAVESREPTASIITRVMETFAWSLHFDRVILMLVGSGKKKLLGRMALGAIDDFDPKKFERPLGPEAGPYAPDAQAFTEGRPIFSGDPLFEDGWPIAAIPIGYGQRSIGVIYADRAGSINDEVSSREQAAIGVLAELLDRSVSIHSK
ncbi:MAG: HDOD domain-containing protein [Oligoflexia bacterium]|nr:HDOD domain-containing protein [Oligoflexia bacterium]